METVLQEINDFMKKFEEIENSNKELLEFNALLQEELRLARDAEKSSESKKTRCQSFLNQQQEVIQRLLTVKEENENLKYTLAQTERNLTTIQNNIIEEQLRNNKKAEEIEQEYLKKIIKVQEDADQQVEKSKSEYLEAIGELRISVSKLEEQLEQKDAVIMSLQEEVQHIKDWSAANIETFHKKLAEQERKHQSELETWKMAELNRTVFEHIQQKNSIDLYEGNQKYQQQYQSPQVLGPMQEYPSNARLQEPIIAYKKTPLVTHYKNVLPRHNTNLVRPLSTSGNVQSTNTFLSASDIYNMQSHMSAGNNKNVEDDNNSAERMKENKKPILIQKPKVLAPNKKRKLFNSNQNIM